MRLASFFLAALVTSAVASAQPASASTLDRVRDSGVFTIAYRADARPYSYRTEGGEPAGYIVDLCREVATAVRKHVGGDVRIAYQVVPADRRFETVRDGKADILCDPSTVTLARRELVDFSLPTFIDGAGVLSRDSKPIEQFENLDGRHVGVLTGTTTEQVLRESVARLRLQTQITTVRDHREGVDLLTADRIDVYFGDRGILASFLTQRRLAGFRVAPRYFSFETYALAIARDDSAFRLLVDRTLAELYRSGRIRTLLARTFGRMEADEMLEALIIMHSLPER